MSSIDTGASYIGSILRDGKPYVVPKFQRDYSWTAEEVDQLWSDIATAIEEKRDSYFIGSIVINDGDSSSYSVIDGQQRLTTISLLICALRDTCYSKDNAKLADRLAGDFLGKFEYATGETTPKLTLNVLNRSFYNDKIINSANVDELKTFSRNTRNPKSNRLIALAYLHLLECVERRLDSGMLLTDLIQELVTAIDDTIQVIRISVKDDYDAYMLFETLNDRGLALSVADLLKNYFFSKSEEKIEDVQDNWQEMISNLGKTETKRYLRHVWLSKYGVVRDKDLYSKIKEKFSTKSKVISFSKELKESSELYASLSDPKASLWASLEESERYKVESLIEELCLFGVNQYNPLLLAVWESNSRIFYSVLRMITVFSFRYSIIMGMGPGNIERNFSEAALYVRNNTNCSASDVFKRIQHLYPSDEDFYDAFKEKEITQSSIARYILRKINDKLEEGSGLVVNKNSFAMNLEHVMPQNIKDKEWMQHGEDSEVTDYIHRLGNMTLLSTGINRKVANSSFNEKLIEYRKTTPLKISEGIFDKEEWTLTNIDNRQIQLAKIAKCIWRVDY